jgi:hypothetical protein
LIAGEQGLDLGAESVIAGTGGIQEPLLLGGGEVGGGEKQLLNSIPILESHGLGTRID